MHDHVLYLYFMIAGRAGVCKCNGSCTLIALVSAVLNSSCNLIDLASVIFCSSCSLVALVFASVMVLALRLLWCLLFCNRSCNPIAQASVFVIIHACWSR